MHLRRSIAEPIRPYSSWEEQWRGPDQGLIWCWERGRQIREAHPEIAAAAERGELGVWALPSPWQSGDHVLGWRGGVTRKLKAVPLKRDGTLRYLAEWQGLRGEDLDIDMESEQVIVCTRTGLAVLFSSALPAAPADDEMGGKDAPSASDLALPL